jgi:uncharacterized protein YbaR (Trm112 family)
VVEYLGVFGHVGFFLAVKRKALSMRRKLLEILACPHCRGGLALTSVIKENSIRVLSGELQCEECQRRYPIEKGIPRLVEAAADVRRTGRRFDFEWVSRWTGCFEGKGRCHGFNHDEYVGWMRNRLTESGPLKPGERILDAGCGSGEKTRVLAELCPNQEVVGLDLGIGSLENASAQFGGVENLDYVQGNILQPPLRQQSFRWGISIGMLHHTPDTRRAFAEFRKLLVDEPAMLIWIYRPFWEAPEWRLMYFARDGLFLGQSPKLPPALLRMFSFGAVAAFLPVAQFEWWRHARRMAKDLPFFRPTEMTFGEGFTAQVFHLFDTLLPRYQFRHTPKEVEGWIEEEGLKQVFHAHSYYLACVPHPA